MLGFALGLRSKLDMLMLCVFVFAGIARLARFNITKNSKKAKFFEGFPIPSSLFIVILMWISFEYHLGIVPGYYMFDCVHSFSLIWAVWSALMMSQNLHVAKL